MNYSKQKGMTFIGLVVVLGILGIFVFSVLKVFPVYMEHFSVTKSMEAVENNPKIKTLSSSAIKSLLVKKFDMNEVTSVTHKEIKVHRGTGDLSVSITYEVRDDYLGNVDIVLSFHDEFTVPL